MPDLNLDTTFLRELGKDLRVVADEFKNANNKSDDVGEDVGHDDLADAVREFAHNWDDRRKEMMANIETLAEAAKVVGETFENVENELVAALEKK